MGWAENGEPPLEPPCSVAFSGFFQCGGVLSLDGNLLSTCLQFKMKNHYLETAEDKNWTAGGLWGQNLRVPVPVDQVLRPGQAAKAAGARREAAGCDRREMCHGAMGS